MPLRYGPDNKQQTRSSRLAELKESLCGDKSLHNFSCINRAKSRQPILLMNVGFKDVEE